MVTTRKAAADAKAATNQPASQTTRIVAPAASISAATPSPGPTGKSSKKKAARKEEAGRSTKNKSKSAGRRRPDNNTGAADKYSPQRTAKLYTEETRLRTRHHKQANPCPGDITDDDRPKTEVTITRRSARQCARARVKIEIMERITKSGNGKEREPPPHRKGFGRHRATEIGPVGATSREVSEDLKRMAADPQSNESPNEAGSGSGSDSKDSSSTVEKPKGMRSVKGRKAASARRTGESSIRAGKKVNKGTKKKSVVSNEPGPGYEGASKKAAKGRGRNARAAEEPTTISELLAP